jgi:hypothetical protein
MTKAVTYNCLDPELYFNDLVNISVDTVSYNPNAKFKVLLQREPPEVVNVIPSIIANSHHFDLILAWHPDILENCPNAELLLFGTCWIDVDTFKADKKDEISFLMSNKQFAPGHRLRHQVWDMLDGFTLDQFSFNKIKTPPRIPNKDVIFTNAKFSIIIENVAKENWVTEKLIDCLVTNTIPIYYGCPNVGKWFNEDGIIKFNTIDELRLILNKLTPNDYDSKLEALNDNLSRALGYYRYFDRVKNKIDEAIKR